MCPIYWLDEWNNAQLDNAKDVDVVIPMYNLTEYSDLYLETSGSLWQHYRDETALIMLAVFLIFLLIIIIVFRLNL